MSEEKGSELTPAEKENADIRVNEIEENHDTSLFEPLFDESMTEDQLKGEDPDNQEETGEKPEKETKPQGIETDKPAKEGKESTEEKQSPEKEEAAPSESKDDEKPSHETQEEEPDYSKPPPKGYVAIPALREAREEIRELKHTVSQQNQAIESLKQTKTEKDGLPEEFKDFKVLSSQEYKELVEEDVEEAMIYRDKLDRYKDYQQTIRNQKEAAQAANNQARQIIDASLDKMVTEIPGIFDDDKGIGNELAQFAVENGIPDAYLELMSNPATRIVPVDENGNPLGKTYVLGDGAAGLVTLIHRLRGKLVNSDPDKIRSEIEKELEPKLREKITAELVEKFKNETGGQSFRSINDVPGGDDSEITTKKFISEADYAKMSEQEKERLLAGA